jgi:type II secretory pathway component PulF
MNPLSPIQLVLRVLLIIGSCVGPIVLLYGVYWVISMPLRRRERARLFFDLIETGLEDGHAPELVIVEAAKTKDPILGANFHLLAAYIEQGIRLPEALTMVRRLVPPECAAMLKVGAELGDLRAVLPACRRTLNDAFSQTRGAANYLAITAFVLLPIVPVLTWMICVFVMPKFVQIGVDMFEGPMPLLIRAVYAARFKFVFVEVAGMLVIQHLMLCYVAGPRLRQTLRAVPLLGWLVDWFLWRLPWRRHRMQRDFASMLALLLDAGVPESKAVLTAGESANNSIFMARVRSAADRLSNGMTLPEALRKMDGQRELEWRLSNAAKGTQGFVAALRGWFEGLDAKAFQQEQAAAQVFTTAVVLWNGLVVGLFILAVFMFLTTLVEQVALW